MNAMKRKILACALLTLILLAVVFGGTLAAYAKSALFIAQVFPAIAVKPLEAITPASVQSRVTISLPRGTVFGDLFLPAPGAGPMAAGSTPAVILAMGVRVLEQDRPVIYNLGRALSRLGFAVLWPRLEALDQEVPSTEEPSTFVAAYRYLEDVEIVDPRRISCVGFSTGSSIALVAASDAAIADRVRAVVFFGGYFDIFDYLADIVTQSAVCGGTTIPWRVERWVGEHMREILEYRGATGVTPVFAAASRGEAAATLRAAPLDEIEDLRRIDPRARLDRFRARIFILHDEGDLAVPYCEATRLKDALPPGVEATYLLVHVFEHVSPSGAISPDTLTEFGRFLSFLAAVLEYM